uniref:Uncharacterized protein n=1 Tax=Rhizophora mucronata TaxID=61149 RepID=A0A2P2QPF1_RHIMU
MFCLYSNFSRENFFVIYMQLDISRPRLSLKC